MLLGVQLPLALPNIMQGINQCTMMALAMVVIASMIGTRGLGDEVLLGLQQLNVGAALEAGLAIVLLANNINSSIRWFVGKLSLKQTLIGLLLSSKNRTVSSDFHRQSPKDNKPSILRFGKIL